MVLEALIFDVDGTLADTERDGHRLAFNAAFCEFGLDWDWGVPLYGKLLQVTGGKERIRHYIDNFCPDFVKPKDFDDLVVALHKAKTRHYVELLERGGIPLRSGVKRLLDEARAAGIRLAIATTTTPENVTALLRHALNGQPGEWFEVIAAGDIVPAKKPAPDIYFWALDKLKLDAGRCLALEDSENGLKASLGAGLRTVVTVNDYTTGHAFTGAVAVLSDLGEPGRPFRNLGTEAAGQEYVDLGLLRRWHASP
ncbi:MAG: HAD family hydrolase [Sulfuricella sp.]|nr:HAD family hydrolase [Sulfuricella sp.]